LSRHLQSVLVVTGLAAEARIAAGPGVEVVCSGSDPARLRALLDGLVPSRYSAAVSFGISGGLDPALNAGDVVIATQITSDADVWPMAAALVGALADRLSMLGTSVSRAAVAGVNAPVMDAAGKATLRTKTGAAAVDMESHVAARFAAAAGLPACALRVISDPAERGLPPLATRALKPDGRVDFPAVLAGIAGNPGQIPLLIRAGRDARMAFATLRRVRGLLDPGLGLDRAGFTA
jgi:hopanoid-associated phosphorylase